MKIINMCTKCGNMTEVKSPWIKYGKKKPKEDGRYLTAHRGCCDDKFVIDQSACISCGSCQGVCPVEAPEEE